MTIKRTIRIYTDVDTEAVTIEGAIQQAGTKIADAPVGSVVWDFVEIPNESDSSDSSLS